MSAKKKKAAPFGRPWTGWYTVVGIYEDNSQRFSTHVYAKSPRDAERLAIDEASGGLLVAAVFRGKRHKAVDEDPSPDVAGPDAWEEYQREMYGES